MDSEELPLRQAFFGLIFAVLFVIAGALAVSASYDNQSSDPHAEEDADHSEEGGDADHTEEGGNPSTEEHDE